MLLEAVGLLDWQAQLGGTFLGEIASPQTRTCTQTFFIRGLWYHCTRIPERLVSSRVVPSVQDLGSLVQASLKLRRSLSMQVCSSAIGRDVVRASGGLWDGGRTRGGDR